MAQGFEFYEKAMRGLASLFPEDNPFWDQFLALKKSYYKTLVTEKKVSHKKGRITPELFQEIAIGKSSMSFAAVISLECLADSPVERDLLIDCIKDLHIGIQYMDDIDDFKVDIKEGQWTYPLYLTQEYVKEKGLIIQNPWLLQKYLYLSGIAQKNLGFALSHFEKSISKASEAGLPAFVRFLEKQISNCQFHLQEIENLFLKTEIKSQKSFEMVVGNNLDSSIQSALTYLENNINESFEWKDFLTSAGQSTSWTSAYVGMQLAEVNSCHPVLKSVIQHLISKNANSFNAAMIQDGDSSSFLVGLLQKSDSIVDSQLLKIWLEFMNANGGWVTYRDSLALREKLDLPLYTSVEGWTNSHACVTAAAAYILSSIPSLRLDYEITCLQLAGLLKNKNRWSSYWWTSDVYATSFAIQALTCHQEFKVLCEAPAQWLAKEQDSRGYWPNPMTGESSAFYTALAVKALLMYDASSFEESISQGVKWLLTNQTQDGSWQTNRILRIPATDVINPSTVTHWRKSSFGVNCLVDDHNRLFTTSTVVNALHHFSSESCF